MIITAAYQAQFYRVQIVVFDMPDTYQPTASLWRRTTSRPVWEAVREGYAADSSTGGMIIYDYEAPYGELITYAVTAGTSKPTDPQPDPGPTLGPNLAANGSADHGLAGWSTTDPASFTLTTLVDSTAEGGYAARSERVPQPTNTYQVVADTYATYEAVTGTYAELLYPPTDTAVSQAANVYATPADPSDSNAALVTGGVEYYASAMVRVDRTLQITARLLWLDASGAVIEQSDVVGAVGPDDQWSRFFTEGLPAPEGATVARVQILADTVDGAPAEPGTLVDVDAVTVQEIIETGRVIATATLTIPFTGQPILRDLGNPLLTQLVVVVDIGEPARAGRHGIHQVAGRVEPVVISDVRLSRTGQITLYTQTRDQARAMRALHASGQPLLLQVPCADVDFADCYMAVAELVETPIMPTRRSPARLWSLPYTEVARPAGDVIPVAQQTYQDVADTYATYGDVFDAVASYLELALGAPPLYPGPS